MNAFKLKKIIRSYIRDVDMVLIFSVVILCIAGIINMFGIDWGGSLFRKQIILVIIGFTIMILFSFLNYRYLKNYSFPVLVLYVFSLVLLGFTFYSQSVRGTNSWLILGNFTFEPAELTKLCLIILMAKYFSQKHVYIYQFKYLIASGLYFIIPAELIINQPDLGSAIILSLIWGSLLVAAGINKKHLLTLCLVAAVIVSSAWLLVLKPYQKERVISFLNQEGDPLGSGYNLIQSKIAIGSGSWFGNGLGNGSQATLGFLPEPHNDFILASFTEQFGFVGIVLLLGVMLLLVYRILSIGLGAGFNFGKLFSVGMAVFIFSHVFISAGVNIGIMPVTGLPLPFLSSGGSNLVSVMAGLGILQSIKRYG